MLAKYTASGARRNASGTDTAEMTTFGSTDGDPGPGQFFTSRRMVAYPLLFLGASFVVSLGWLLASSDLIDPQGQPLGEHFLAFWGASRLALDGLASFVFDADAILAAERLAVPPMQTSVTWHGAPTFLLLTLPLALLPYALSLGIWTLGGLTALASVLRKMAPQPQTVLLLFAFPGTFINLFQGQSGFIVAALFGGALLLLQRKQVHAGILIGLLCIRPQYLPIALIALACGRHWNTLAAAAATATILMLLSLLTFGMQPWIAFWNDLATLQGLLDDGALPWTSMPSVYATLRLLGLGTAPAYAAHFIVALAAAALTGLVWWRKPSLPLRAAVLVTATLIATPTLFDYDLAILAIPLALLAMDGHFRGWLSGEREMLGLVWFMPLVAASIAQAIGLQVGAIALIVVFGIAVRRILVEIGPIRLAIPMRARQ